MNFEDNQVPEAILDKLTRCVHAVALRAKRLKKPS